MLKSGNAFILEALENGKILYASDLPEIRSLVSYTRLKPSMKNREGIVR